MSSQNAPLVIAKAQKIQSMSATHLAIIDHYRIPPAHTQAGNQLPKPILDP